MARPDFGHPASNRPWRLAVVLYLGVISALSHLASPPVPRELALLGDEAHQAFVPGRDGSLADAVADAVGAALGAAVAVLARKKKVSNPAKVSRGASR